MTNSSQHYKKLSTEQLQEILSSPASSPESIRAAEEELLERGESVLFALKSDEPGTYKKVTILDRLYPFNRAHGYADHVINIFSLLLVVVIGLPQLFFLIGTFFAMDLFVLLLAGQLFFHLFIAYLFWRREKTGWMFIYALLIQLLIFQVFVIAYSAGANDDVLIIFALMLGIWSGMLWFINRPMVKQIYKVKKTPVATIVILTALLFGYIMLVYLTRPY